MNVLAQMNRTERAHWTIKKNNFNGIICFKVGRFYEIFHKDAELCHEVLGLRYMGGPIAHVGFPEKSFDRWASALVGRGYNVFRVERMTQGPAAEQWATI